jgi:hypothetical protein
MSALENSRDVRVMIYGRTAYAENSAVQGDAALIVAGT